MLRPVSSAIQDLVSPEAKARAAAREALAALSPQELVEAAQAAFQESAAAYALIELLPRLDLPAPEAKTLLEAAARHSSPYVQIAALLQLEHLDVGACATRLAALAKERPLAPWALKQLQRLGPPVAEIAVPALRDVLCLRGEQQLYLDTEALHALGAMAEGALPVLPEVLAHTADYPGVSFSEAMQMLGDVALPALEAALTAAEPEGQAAWGLKSAVAAIRSNTSR